MTCDGCKYWSEVISRANAAGVVKAMCMSENSPNSGTMTRQRCEQFEAGVAVDTEPPF